MREKPMLYFAYGSNMQPEQLQERCPSAKFLCPATLEDHRLAFTRTSVRNWPGYGVADVVAAAGERVWGAVLEIADNDIPALDGLEGYRPQREKNAYRRIEVSVCKGGDCKERILAQTYVVCAREEPNPLPHRDYVGRIIAGAQSIHAPTDYIERLQAIAVRE